MAYTGSLQTTTQGRGRSTGSASVKSSPSRSTSSATTTLTNSGGGGGSSSPRTTAAASPSVGLADGTFMNSRGETVVVRSGPASGPAPAPITRTTSGQTVRQVAPEVYATSGGRVFSAASPRVEEDLKAQYLKQNPEMQLKPGIYQGGALIVSPGRAGQYTAGQLFRDVRAGTAVVQYESAQKWRENRSLALQKQQNDSDKNASGRYVVTNPDTGKQVDLATAKNAAEAFKMAGYRPPENLGRLDLLREKSIFTLKGDGALPAWYVPGKGTEVKGSRTVYRQVITAQNPTEARLAGLPEPGSYELLSDVRDYKPRESAIARLNRKTGERIEQAGSNRKVSLSSVSRDVEAFGARVRAENRATAERVGMPQGPPSGLGDRFAKGGRAFVYSTAKVGEYSGLALQTIGGDIRERPVELATVAASGFATKLADRGLLTLRGSQLLQGSGTLARTGRGAVTTTRIGSATVLGGAFVATTGAEAYRLREQPDELVKLGVRTGEDLAAFGAGMKLVSGQKLPTTSGPRGDVRIRQRSTERFETTSPTLESPVAPRTTTTTTFTEQFTGGLRPTNAPVKTRITQYPSGTLSRVQTTPELRIVTTQKAGKEFAIAKLYEQGQLVKVQQVKAAASGPGLSTKTFDNRAKVLSKQIAPNVIAQASAAQRQAIATTRINGREYRGVLQEQSTGRALSIAGDARVREFGRIVQNRGRGGRIVRSQTGKTKRSTTQLSIGDEATAARNEYTLTRGQFQKGMDLVQTGEPTLVLGKRSAKVERPVAGLTAKRAVGSVAQSETVSEVVLSKAATQTRRTTPKVLKDLKPIVKRELRKATAPARKTYAAGQSAAVVIGEAESKAIAAVRVRRLKPTTQPQVAPVFLTERGQPTRALPPKAPELKAQEPERAQMAIDPQPREKIAPRGKERGQEAERPNPISRLRDELGIIQEGKPLSVTKPFQRTGSGSRSRERSNTVTEALPKLSIEPKNEQRQKLREGLAVRQKPITRPTFARQMDYGRGRQTTITPLPKTKLPRISTNSDGGGFNVLVRRRGKFKKLNPSPLSSADALKLGKEKVTSTLAASVKVVDTRGRSIDTRTALGTLGGAFRTGKKDPTTFVQKAAFRLSSRGERESIQAARKSRAGSLFR